MESSPVLDPNGNLYLSVNQDNVSVGGDGKKRWDMVSPYWLDASPAVAANGEVYFSFPWRYLMAVTQDGHEAWRFYTDTNPDHGNIIASPAIGSDGTIYVAEENWLLAINSSHALAPLAKSSWPMFRANPRHTGRLPDGN
jgi:outer membrane protein assembly factor BamB